MRTFFWALAIVASVIAVSSMVYTCGYSRDDMEYVLTDEMVLSGSGADAVEQATDNGSEHVMQTHIKPGRLTELFNDSNALQLQAARANGIDPIIDIKSAYRLKRSIVRVSTCDVYYVDSMRYAHPYLVPKAAKLLHDIAKAFQDTIKVRGGKGYRVRVNSLLRTEHSVSKLRKRNSAATEQSCHLYGTTFDISWTKFDCLDDSYRISLESLKNILAEIVYNFKDAKRCYAIYERKQGCFHITVR